MEIKKGSVFTLYDKSLNLIEDLVFEENKTYYGDRMDYLPDGNKQVYFIEGIDTVFPKSGVRFDDLAITVENGNVTWIKNNSSNANFCFEDIDYYTVNDSICHFKCSGEERKYCFLYSIYDTIVQVKADIKLKLKNIKTKITLCSLFVLKSKPNLTPASIPVVCENIDNSKLSLRIIKINVLFL